MKKCSDHKMTMVNDHKPNNFQFQKQLQINWCVHKVKIKILPIHPAQVEQRVWLVYTHTQCVSAPFLTPLRSIPLGLQQTWAAPLHFGHRSGAPASCLSRKGRGLWFHEGSLWSWKEIGSLSKVGEEKEKLRCCYTTNRFQVKTEKPLICQSSKCSLGLCWF